jgi:hypothetical protein
MIEILFILISIISQPVLLIVYPVVEMIKILWTVLMEKANGLLPMEKQIRYRYRLRLFHWGKVREQKNKNERSTDGIRKIEKEIEINRGKNIPAGALARSAGFGYYSPGTN